MEVPAGRYRILLPAGAGCGLKYELHRALNALLRKGC